MGIAWSRIMYVHQHDGMTEPSQMVLLFLKVPSLTSCLYNFWRQCPSQRHVCGVARVVVVAHVSTRKLPLVWLKQCHEPPIGLFLHIYTTYKNGDDRGINSRMIALSTSYPLKPWKKPWFSPCHNHITSDQSTDATSNNGWSSTTGASGVEGHRQILAALAVAVLPMNQ